MLDRFLELALVTEDPGSSWNDLQRLGFAGATSGDIWTHAYGVVACEGLAIGLHASGDEPLSLHFVHADVAALDRELGARFIEVESSRLGSDVFNELCLREPGGVLLRVIAARTFSPPLEMPQRTAPGRFIAVSLPCANLGDAQGFWERLDMEVSAGSDPWESITVQGTPLAYHQSASFADVALLFDSAKSPDDEALRAAGWSSGRQVAALRARKHRVLRGPVGPAFILLAEAQDPRHSR